MPRATHVECSFGRVYEYERSATVSSSESDGELPASCDDEPIPIPTACSCDCDEEAAPSRLHDVHVDDGAGECRSCAMNAARSDADASHSLLALNGKINSAYASHTLNK